ncbi:MAG: hypothetical protein ACXW36_11700 [Nitrospira sp.]
MMIKQKYICWKDGDRWMGHREVCPGYWNQGHTEAELKEHLSDLFRMMRKLSLRGGIADKAIQSLFKLSRHRPQVWIATAALAASR